MHTNKDVEKLADEFAGCQKILTAIGDENRLNLIMVETEFFFGSFSSLTWAFAYTYNEFMQCKKCNMLIER